VATVSEPDELAVWLRAVLDKVERVAKAAQPSPWRRFIDRSHLDRNTIFGGSYPGDVDRLRNVCSVEYSWERDANAEHIMLHDPAQALRQVEAIRRVLVLYDVSTDRQLHPDGWELLKHAVRALALPYAEWPGYRKEWAP
jgi:hypothetical protein